MMTVRFPDGTSIQYNQATYAIRSSNGYTDLYTKEGGGWIAQVPNTALIELRSPCRIYNALTNKGSIHALMGAMRGFGMYSDEMSALIQLKKALTNLKTRSRTWK